MKKSLFILALISALFLTSCGDEPAEKDECGCFVTFKDAKKDAKENNRNILLVITVAGGDVTSSAFIENVIKSEDFANTIAKDFTVFHWDVSQAAFEKTVAPEDATKEQKQAAEKAEKIMTENINYVMNIGGGAYSPQFFILSKEAYPITEVMYEDFEDEIKTEDFSVLVHNYDAPVAEFNAIIEATKNGSKEERIQAIDKVYTSVNELYRIEMIDLWREAISLDKKNTSGLTGKFIYSIAESDAAEKFSNNDVEGAIKVLVDAAENPAMLGNEVQQCYYMASYILASTGSSDTKLMTEYLDKAYDAAPESEIAANVKAMADYYRNYNPNEIEDLDYEDLGIDLSELIDMTQSAE